MSPRRTELEALLAEGLELAATVETPDNHAQMWPPPPPAAQPAAFRTEEQEGLPLLGQRLDDAHVELGRPSPSLKPTWIDPEETPFTPVPRPGSRFKSSLVSVLLAVAVIATVAWFLTPAVKQRFRMTDSLVLTDGVLTAQAVELAPLGPARVIDIYVREDWLDHSRIPAGTPVALLERETAQNGLEQFEVATPFAARLVSIDSRVGDIAYPGVPVATVFDPTTMEVVMSVPLDRLADLRSGMRAVMTSPTVDTELPGTVVSAVALLGSVHAPNRNRLVNVRIKPDDDSAQALMPGLRLDAVVDLRTGDPDQPSLAITSELREAPERLARQRPPAVED